MNLKTALRAKIAKRVITCSLATAMLAPALMAAPTLETSNRAQRQHVEKISNRLLWAYEESHGRGGDLGSVLPASFYQHGAKGLILDIYVDAADSRTVKSIEAVAGVEVVFVSENFNCINVEISRPDAIFDLAAIDDVRSVSAPTKPSPRVGLVTSRAVQAHNVDIGMMKYGVDGSGQRVGILSDSFAWTDGVRRTVTTPPAGQAGILRRAKNQDSGDLPSEVILVFDGIQGSDEGAGMAELVHDIAPGSSIAYHSAGFSEAAFAEGILRLWRDAASSVIVDDIGNLDEPVYQHSVISQAAQTVSRAGVPYLTAAGNDANKALRFEYNDINPAVDDEVFPPTGNDFHVWPNGTAYLPIAVLPFDVVSILVNWNQPNDKISPGNGSQIDFDAYLALEPNLHGLRAGMNVGLMSIERQGTTGSPAGNANEVFFVGNFGFSPLYVYLVIDHHRGNQENIPQDLNTPVELTVIVPFSFADIQGVTNDDNRTGGPTMFGHVTVPEVFAVGAVGWYDTPRFDTSFGQTSEIDPQDFTSLGGDFTVHFDSNGNFNPERFFKPDFAAVQGNNTTFFGGELDLSGYAGEPDAYPNFFGTSASAPNAAAIVALMKELNPGLAPSEIKEILQSTAIDVIGRRAGPGVDATTGHGLIDAEAALDEVARRVGIMPSPTPEPPPTQENVRTFTFNTSAEGWSFAAPAGFTAPESSASESALVMRSRDNTNTFGFWESPTFRVGEWQRPGDNPLLGNVGETSLFRVVTTVRGNQSDLSRVPVARFRTSTENFEKSDVLVITSAGDGSVSPNLSGRTYRQYFNVPTTQSRFRSSMEILNFDPSDAADGALFIENVRVEVLSADSLFSPRFEGQWSFTGGNTNGWSVRSAEGLAVPFSKVDPEGLRIGPSANNSATHFAFWASPEGAGDAVTLEAGRLYKAIFTINSNATSGQKSLQPAFRLRANDASNKLSAYVNIESSSQGARLPVGGSPQTYILYFEAPPLLSGSTVNFAFDYLLVPQAQNDPSVFLRLEKLRVESYLAPF